MSCTPSTLKPETMQRNFWGNFLGQNTFFGGSGFSMAGSSFTEDEAVTGKMSYYEKVVG